MSNESPLDYLRKANPEVVHKLRASLTDQEWESLSEINAKAMEDPDFYEELRAAPLEALKEKGYELSDEVIEFLKGIYEELHPHPLEIGPPV